MTNDCICSNVPRIWRLAGVTRTVRLTVTKDGSPYDFTGLQTVLRIDRDNSDFHYEPQFTVEGDDNNIIMFAWAADKQPLGDYTIEVTVTDGSGNKDRVNWHGATGVRLVEYSNLVKGEDAAGVESDSELGLDGIFTMNGVGMDAYEEWLADGNEGSLHDYILWMQGPAREAAEVAEAQMAVIQSRADDDHSTAGSDHTRAAADHTTAESDHTRADEDHQFAFENRVLAYEDHLRAEDDHTTAAADHTTAQADRATAGSDHTRAEADHATAASDHSTAASDHTKAGQDSTRAGSDHDIAVADHAQAEADHTRAEGDHTTAAADHTTAAADHTTAASDHTTAAADHTQAVADHAVMAGYDTRLTNVETDVTQLGQNVCHININKINNKADAYADFYAARNALPSSYRTPGVVLCYLLSSGWVEEQWIGSTYNRYQDADFLRIINEKDIRFVSSKDWGELIVGLYITGIAQTDLSLYEVMFYNNRYGIWGVDVTRKSDSVVVAKGRFSSSTTPSSIVYALEEQSSSGISGYYCCNFDATRSNVYGSASLYDTSLFLGSSPIIIKHLLEQEIAGVSSDLADVEGILINRHVPTPVYQDGYYLLNSTSISYSDTGDYALAVFDISEYVGKVGTISIETINMANGYLNVWGVVNSIAAGQDLLLYGPRANGPTSDTFQIPNKGKYLAVQCKKTEHSSSANIVVTVIPTIEKEISELQEVETVEISLPDKIYAVVGDTLQLFYRGMVLAPDPYIYDISINCLKGQRYARYFEYTPVAGDVGTTNFQISVIGQDGNVIGTKSCDLVTVAAPTSPASAKKVVCLGDSLTNGGQWPVEANRRLTGNGGTPSGKGLSNIQFCGEMSTGQTGYFGMGGWTWYNYLIKGATAFRFQVSGVTSISYGAVYRNNGHDYTVREVNITNGSGNILCSVASASDTPEASGTLTRYSGSGDSTVSFSSAMADVTNPIWDVVNNKMSFVPYANEYCGGTIDVIYMLLGSNGLTAFQHDYSSVLTSAATFADTLHSEFPNAKLKILGIPCPNQKDTHGYGANGGYSDTYGITFAAMKLNEAYQAFANDDDYSSFVEFVNVSSQFDSEYNMQTTTKAVNTRNTETEIVGSNGLHPADSGYNQIADVVYRNIVAKFCQSS